jgi:hypothetical protein
MEAMPRLIASHGSNKFQAHRVHHLKLPNRLTRMISAPEQINFAHATINAHTFHFIISSYFSARNEVSEMATYSI